MTHSVSTLPLFLPLFLFLSTATGHLTLCLGEHIVIVRMLRQVVHRDLPGDFPVPGVLTHLDLRALAQRTLVEVRGLALVGEAALELVYPLALPSGYERGRNKDAGNEEVHGCNIARD